MAQFPFDSERPPDERWWERELNRNEKLLDKYMSTADESADWTGFYAANGLFQPANLSPHLSRESEPEDSAWEDDEEFPDPAGEEWDTELDDPSEAAATEDDCIPNSPEDESEYAEIARVAHDFGVRVLQLEGLPEEATVVLLSAGKVGAHLAGGHGLGYDEETLCGNIVKCRWALSDSEFCREMLDYWHRRTGRADLRELSLEAARLSQSIRERVARLRARVWW